MKKFTLALIQVITSILVILAASSILSSSSEDVVASKKLPTGLSGQPFLLLVSNNEISVAQLPMIDHGMITTVYQITGQRKEQTSRLRRSVRSTRSFGELHNRTADEHIEQQMPDGAGLRKFTRRHTAPHEITSLAPPSAPVSASASPSKHQNNQGASVEERRPAASSSGWTHDAASTREPTEEASGRGGKEHTQRRRRRSTRSSHSNELTNISITDNNGQSGVASSVPESQRGSAGQLANVTSALFRGRRELREPSAAQPAVRNTEPEENQAERSDAAGPVRFEDFDAHMRLGYVFVADSLGRIHRFRLSGFQSHADDKATDDALVDNLIDAGTEREERTSDKPSAAPSAVENGYHSSSGGQQRGVRP